MNEIHRQRFEVTNVAEFKRREKRKTAQSTPESSVHMDVQRLTQRTVKFIRWLKNHMDQPCHRDDAIARLTKIHSRL